MDQTETNPSPAVVESETVSEQPAETPVTDQTVETPVAGQPVETPVAETPKETPAADQPAGTPVAETPTETPADQPVETSVAEPETPSVQEGTEESVAVVDGGEKVEGDVGQVGGDKVPPKETKESSPEVPASSVQEVNASVVNGCPAGEGSEEESNGAEKEATTVSDSTATKGKEQKKPSQKESKSKSKSRETSKTKDSKGKRKEDKSIEHVLKALSSLNAPEEKLAALCKKYTELLEEHKSIQADNKQSQRQLAVLVREKEQLQMEHSKTLLAKSKMESLCRELQKHNKLIKEESLARVKEEEEKRREVANRFQTTITDIQTQMQDNYSKNTKLREENIELATRLKDLVANYEKAQTQVERVFKQNLQLTQEKEKDCKEKQLLCLELEQSNKKMQVMECTETQLRGQLALYTEKYEDFQSTLKKSNEVFTTFKQEMDKMTKKIKKLEKETMMWKGRCENSNKALVDMAEEKTRRDQEMGKLQNKIQKLEKLCRALQAERNSLKSDSDRGSSRGVSPLTKDVSPTPDYVGGVGDGLSDETAPVEQTQEESTIEEATERSESHLEQTVAVTDHAENASCDGSIVADSASSSADVDSAVDSASAENATCASAESAIHSPSESAPCSAEDRVPGATVESSVPSESAVCSADDSAVCSADDSAPSSAKSVSSESTTNKETVSLDSNSQESPSESSETTSVSTEPSTGEKEGASSVTESSENKESPDSEGTVSDVD